MNKLLLTSSAIALILNLNAPIAFANSNAGSKVFICAVPQNVDLAKADYELLAWTEIKGIGSHGETGISTNVLTYDTWDTTVIQKAKGMTDAGSPTIEVARNPTDPGQMILRTAGDPSNNQNYAFKMLRNDPANIGGVPSVLYNRGLVMGPTRPFGRNEDFDIEVFTLGLQQKEIVVNPLLSGNPPVNTVLPAITGTPKVGTQLTVSNGTFTGDATISYAYQWFNGGVPVPGATLSTFTPTVTEQGKIMTCRVAATNNVGSAIAMSAATAVVAP